MKKVKYLYFTAEVISKIDGKKVEEVVVVPIDKIESFNYRKETNELFIIVDNFRYKVIFEDFRKDWLKVSDLVPEILDFLEEEWSEDEYRSGVDIELIADRLA